MPPWCARSGWASGTCRSVKATSRPSWTAPAEQHGPPAGDVRRLVLPDPRGVPVLLLDGQVAGGASVLIRRSSSARSSSRASGVRSRQVTTLVAGARLRGRAASSAASRSSSGGQHAGRGGSPAGRRSSRGAARRPGPEVAGAGSSTSADERRAAERPRRAASPRLEQRGARSPCRRCVRDGRATVDDDDADVVLDREDEPQRVDDAVVRSTAARWVPSREPPGGEQLPGEGDVVLRPAAARSSGRSACSAAAQTAHQADEGVVVRARASTRRPGAASSCSFLPRAASAFATLGSGRGRAPRRRRRRPRRAAGRGSG